MIRKETGPRRVSRRGLSTLPPCAGHLDALSHTSLPLVLPNDPALRGIPVSAQGAVLLDAGGFVLSNATTHVIAE